MELKFSKHSIEKLNDPQKGGGMKVKYYPEDDLMVLKVSETVYDYAEKVGNFIIHYTKNKEPVMLEILNASRFLRETTEALPYPVLNKILHLQST